MNPRYEASKNFKFNAKQITQQAFRYQCKQKPTNTSIEENTELHENG